ncbi:MAG TPA: DoxX family protein [Solirubrobacteraceae bacterium]
METTLWIVQGTLAGIFVLTGLTKLTQPRQKMAAGPMSWAADVSDAQFRGIGALELLGAGGLIVPGVLGVAGVLTPLAAVGLALTMAGAVATHARLGEHARVVPPLVLLALAVLVAAERF